MKKKNNVEQKVIVFLYAYLRQIDLSLDRSKWSNWNELREYFYNNINPLEVIKFLSHHYKINCDSEDYLFPTKEPSLILKIEYFILYVMRRHRYLKEKEFASMICLLHKFEEFLKNDYSNYNSDHEKLRIAIATFYSNILEYKLSRKELDKAMRVEHFFQNDLLNVIKISDFGVMGSGTEMCTES